MLSKKIATQYVQKNVSVTIQVTENTGKSTEKYFCLYL